MEKTYRFTSRFNPVWMVAVLFGVTALAVLWPLRSIALPSLVFGAAILGFTAFYFYRSTPGLQRVIDRKLVLDEAGLRYEIAGKSYSMAWDQCDHRIECGMTAVTLVTRDGEWLILNRFEDMPGIIATIRTRVQTSGAQGLAETALLLHRWPGILLSGLAVLGTFIFASPNGIPALPADAAMLSAIILVAPAILIGRYMRSRNPLLKLVRAVQQQGSGNLARRFLISFTVWTVITIVALVILNFMAHK